MAKCKVCGRELTNPESVALGAGPECLKKLVDRTSRPYTVCPTCNERHRCKACPKCQPGDDPFAPSVTDEMPPAKDDSQ